MANIAITLRKYLLPEKCEFDDIIKADGFFNDIAEGIKPHDKYGAVLTREALSDICTKEELDFICEIILNHCNKGRINDDHFTYCSIDSLGNILQLRFGMIKIFPYGSFAIMNWN